LSSSRDRAQSLDAVSRDGPTIVKDAVAAKEFVGKLEIDLIVLALDAAAALAGNSKVKKSISNLADEYSAFKNAWTSAAVPPLDGIL